MMYVKALHCARHIVSVIINVEMVDLDVKACLLALGQTIQVVHIELTRDHQAQGRSLAELPRRGMETQEGLPGGGDPSLSWCGSFGLWSTL